MNEALNRLSKELDLDTPHHERLRLEFGFACAQRVTPLIEAAAVLACLSALGEYLDGKIDRAQFDQFAAEAARLANQHQGSKSIDGCGHAAVSATYAVANALAGKARPAADYAAYATVYGQGGYAAVAEPEAFEAENEWQATTLAALVGRSETS